MWKRAGINAILATLFLHTTSASLFTNTASFDASAVKFECPLSENTPTGLTLTGEEAELLLLLIKPTSTVGDLCMLTSGVVRPFK